jgi:hypothetical protein
VRPASPRANLFPVTAPTTGGETGDIMKKTLLSLYISWLLVFGGSGALLRRA